MPILWNILTIEDKAKLISLMPDDWAPPSDKKLINLDCWIESSPELEKLMRQKPYKPKQVK